ncbi:MAG: FkbM family methyltransferase [Nitrospinales bacterium]
MNLLKRNLKPIIKKISQYEMYQYLFPNRTVKFLSSLDANVVEKAKYFLYKSKSQLCQDIFVLTELNFKQNGYFVEFGASNGIDLSNTYLLEKEFNWNGILAEPAQIWHEDLSKNRKAKIDFECVWKESGKCINFNESNLPLLSTISKYNSSDMHWEDRKSSKTYTVKTVSLLDLLKRHRAPYKIDYLSIDTEGSEYEIIKDFDFDAYSISIISCEHNFTNNRKKIYDLLVSKGFIRKFEHVSNVDDWYVRQKLDDE